MLPAVLHARDRWLKPGGLILPRHAHVSLSAGLIQGKIMRALSVPQHVVMHFLPLTPLPPLPSPSPSPVPLVLLPRLFALGLSPDLPGACGL